MQTGLPTHLYEQVWKRVHPDVLLDVALTSGCEETRACALQEARDRLQFERQIECGGVAASGGSPPFSSREGHLSSTKRRTEDHDAMTFAVSEHGVLAARACEAWFSRERIVICHGWPQARQLACSSAPPSPSSPQSEVVVGIVPVGPDLLSSLENPRSLLRTALNEETKRQIREGRIPRAMMLGDVRVLRNAGATEGAAAKPTSAPMTIVLVRAPLWGCGDEELRTMHAYRGALERARHECGGVGSGNATLVMGVIGDETGGGERGAGGRLLDMAREALRLFVLTHSAFLAGCEHEAQRRQSDGWLTQGPRFSHVVLARSAAPSFFTPMRAS